MEPLPVVSMDCSDEGLLRYLLRASHASHGLLAFRPPAGAAAALQRLRTTVAVRWGAQEVAPDAARALHSLGERFTRATAQRLGMHSYQLHPYCDDLTEWLSPAEGGEEKRTHSAILVSRSPHLGEHIDRGLFNLVLGTPADLAGIQLNLAGEQVGLKALLPSSVAGADELIGLLIPGYTLHCIDPRTPPVSHSVFDPSFERCTVVLQWRLRPDYLLAPGVPLSMSLSQFETSVRAQQQQQVDERREALLRKQAELDARVYDEPSVPGSRKYSLTIQSLSGRIAQVRVHRSWTVANLKWAIHQQHKNDRPSMQRLIYAGKDLGDEQSLCAYSIPAGATLRLVLRLSGD